MEILIATGLIILFIFFALCFLSYWIPKKMGYPKFGKILSMVASVIFTTICILIIFEDQLFSKKDAKELTADQGIELRDDFKIEENKSFSSITLLAM